MPPGSRQLHRNDWINSESACMSEPMTTVLLVATCDTKADEVQFMCEQLAANGGEGLVMDVGVLGQPGFTPQVSNSDVAAAAGASLSELAALGDESLAMTRMASGAARLTASLHAEGKIHAVIILGGTMGTDLALDVAAALPLGVPKLVVSTVSFSHLIPPERIVPDLMMILWAGGLYGLNAICRTILSQAVGATLGACRTVMPPEALRPLVGMTSLGKSCLKYMVILKPALEARGYEVAVFHTTGMGGSAFESLAAKGRFVAVLDLSLQELSNHVNGSIVTSGADRLGAAGRAGIPQIVAPGAVDMIDLPTWQPLPAQYAGRAYHAHNRLISSVATTAAERRATARAIAQKLAAANGPTALLLPLKGVQEWDRPDAPLHAPQAHAEFVDELRTQVRAPVTLVELDTHINDAEFSEGVLQIFDDWVARGWIPRAGAPTS